MERNYCLLVVSLQELESVSQNHYYPLYTLYNQHYIDGREILHKNGLCRIQLSMCSLILVRNSLRQLEGKTNVQISSVHRFWSFVCLLFGWNLRFPIRHWLEVGFKKKLILDQSYFNKHIYAIFFIIFLIFYFFFLSPV